VLACRRLGLHQQALQEHRTNHRRLVRLVQRLVRRKDRYQRGLARRLVDSLAEFRRDRRLLEPLVRLALDLRALAPWALDQRLELELQMGRPEQAQLAPQQAQVEL